MDRQITKQRAWEIILKHFPDSVGANEAFRSDGQTASAFAFIVGPLKVNVNKETEEVTYQ